MTDRGSCADRLEEVEPATPGSSPMGHLGRVEHTEEPGRFSRRFGTLEDVDPQGLAAEVAQCFGDRGPRPSQRVLDDPAGILAAYRDVVRVAWREVEPLWAGADALLGKEAERVGGRRGQPEPRGSTDRAEHQGALCGQESSQSGMANDSGASPLLPTPTSSSHSSTAPDTPVHDDLRALRVLRRRRACHMPSRQGHSRCAARSP